MKRKAIFLLYRLLQASASPVILFYLLLRGLRDRRYFSTIGERCGFLAPSWQQTVSGSIWLHAVSVGEVLATIPLIEELKRRAPAAPVFVSTATLAGFETGTKRLNKLASGIFFAPFDTVWAVRRVLRRLRPSVLVILETEIWPNLFRESKRIGCGLILVNGRISDNSFPRYRRLASLFSPILGLCDRILTQSDEMMRRFIAAGAQPQSVNVGGNLKYDLPAAPIPPDSPALRFIEADGNRPLWIAASTCADDAVVEEDWVISAQRGLPGWRLIVAPRQPARFDDAAGRLGRSGLRWTRRSALNDPASDVLLLDSIGELSGLFEHAQIVFMGGTLAAKGGHNILEPAIAGKPVIVGPHMENFRDIEDHFARMNAFKRIESGDELSNAVLCAASDTELGNRARFAAEQKRGAAARAAEAVMSLYDSRYPSYRRPQPAYAFLWSCSLLWQAASARDRRRKRASVRRLPVPVVGIGNITAGGTGKTPMTIELLREFAPRQPGVLTRGHGRATSETVILVEPGDEPSSITGDEAQLTSRVTGAPIGIGPDRFSTGLQLIDAAGPGLLFLDDGFQHLQLHRDFDLVLIDGLNPFGGGHLLPLGRLREPLEGLGRANAFVITRSLLTPNLKAIENVLRRYNSGAPVFRASTTYVQWVGSDGDTLPSDQLAKTPSVAFCGLGNPDSFWASLRRIGINPLDQHAYDDHHHYTPAEIRRLARHAVDVGAKALLTTAKDAVNLDADYRAIIAPLKLYWLEIGLDIGKRAELIALITAVIDS